MVVLLDLPSIPPGGGELLKERRHVSYMVEMNLSYRMNVHRSRQFRPLLWNIMHEGIIMVDYQKDVRPSLLRTTLHS